MTTASTNTICSNASSANFQAWVNEIYTNLVTNCGLTQTADTGQMAVPCVTSLPGATNTAAGYYIFRFNDTLQATSPIFIKMEFGTNASATTNPKIWITVGTGSSGAGTITGTVMTRVCGFSDTSGNITTNYPSYYCYNATQGFLGMAFKLGLTGANECLGGFVLYRSVDNTGAPTADGVMLITNSITANVANSGGNAQCINFNTSALQTLTITNLWGILPFDTTYSLEGSAGMIFPVWQYKGSASSPGWGITNACAMAIDAEISVSSTVTVTVIGALSLTYLNVSNPFGTTGLTLRNYAAGTVGFLMLWQ